MNDVKETQETDSVNQQNFGLLESALGDVVNNVPQASAIPAEIAKPVVADSPPASATTGGEGKRGRGRPKKDGSAPRPAQAKPATQPHNLNGVPRGQLNTPIESRGAEAAAQTAIMMVNVSGMILGGEEAAMRADEIKVAADGFEYYFKRHGVNNVPTWVVLAGALMPYYLRVITTTPAKNKVAYGLRAAWQGVKNTFKKVAHARFSGRDNDERQNDSSANDGAKGA